MRRVFPMLLLLIAITVCVGFYRGWFQVSTIKGPDSEKLDVHFQIDREKMLNDAKSVKDKTKSLLNEEKVGD